MSQQLMPFFSYDLVHEVALYHVVGSFLDYNTLLSSHPSSLTMASSGLQLPVTIQGNEIFSRVMLLHRG
jgi:hypothetical protein